MLLKGYKEEFLDEYLPTSLHLLTLVVFWTR